MKTFIAIVTLGFVLNISNAQVIKCYHKLPKENKCVERYKDPVVDSASRLAAWIINSARRAQGIDTLVFEADTFGFAGDWADSTNRYFYADGNPFSRAAAHRNCANRVVEYEKIRSKEWKHFAECLGTVSFGSDDIVVATSVLSNGLLGSKDHYDVLMKSGYKRIIIGIAKSDIGFSLVVFVTTEFE